MMDKQNNDYPGTNWCICDEKGTCLEHLNNIFTEAEQETAWENLKESVNKELNDNVFEGSKETWFDKINTKMRTGLSWNDSSDVNMEFLMYQAAVLGISYGYYTHSYDCMA